MGFVVFLAFFAMFFLIALIPTWLLLLAYNYIVELMGHPNWEIPVTFLSVLCVAFILATLGRIFGGRRTNRS